MAKTDVEKAGSQVPALPAGDLDGLEDVSASDVLLPIIKINHKEGVFVDSLSGEEFTEFRAIMLGLIKGRVLWPSEVGDEGQMPLCRSLDFTHGRPTEEFMQKDPSRKFPSKVSGFDRGAVEVAISEAAKGPGSDVDLLLPCGDCGLKEWETMPGSKTPWCSEQFIFPILRLTDEGGMAPAYITFQRSAMKACKAYISSFRQAKRPMYTVVTTIKAIHQSRSKVDFVTPEFKKGEGTDPTEWPEYSKNLADIKEFLTTPRVRDDDDSEKDDKEEEEEEEATTKPASKSKSKKDAIEATVVEDEEEEDEEDEDPEVDEDDEPAAEADDDDDEDEEPF